MNITNLLNAGLLMDYGIIDPCCIEDCKMRANDYIIVADDYYALCNYHYAEYLTLWAQQREEARARELSEQIQMEQGILASDLVELELSNE